jgi:hypothetical protein
VIFEHVFVVAALAFVMACVEQADKAPVLWIDEPDITYL